MIGAIAGDVIGSVYEGCSSRAKTFPLFSEDCEFTDDSVLTIAVGSAILRSRSYGDALREWGRRYPKAGYGGWFSRWLASEDPRPYNSFGNGSAMRASPVGWAFADLESVLEHARMTADPTHNHPEGIKGAQAVAGAVFLGRTSHDKAEIRRLLVDRLGYDCSETLDQVRQRLEFDITCQGTVPPAVIAFLESEDFEDAIRNAVSLGGDVDTLTCITGAIAEAYYGGTPVEIQREVLRRLDPPLLEETKAFARRFGVPLHEEAHADPGTRRV